MRFLLQILVFLWPRSCWSLVKPGPLLPFGKSVLQRASFLLSLSAPTAGVVVFAEVSGD